MTEPYRPSSGTEGAWFMSNWCHQCERDRRFRESDWQEDGCSIAAASLAYRLDHPKYPREWIEDENGPRCTAFIPEVPNPSPNEAGE